MATLRPRVGRWGALALLVVGLLLLSDLQLKALEPPRQSAAASADPPPPIRELPLSKSRARSQAPAWRPFPANAPELEVGMLLKNVYNLQVDKQVFSADGWYWLEWGPALEQILRELQLAPEQMVEFVNLVDPWNSRIEAESTDPERILGDRHYQLFRFAGDFYIDSINERHSPFTTLVLPLVIETRPDAFAFSGAAVRLKPARNQATLSGSYSDMAGYSIQKNWIEERQGRYDQLGRQRDDAYSQLRFNVAYGSETWAAFMKWILPLLIVMSIVLLAPSLESSLGEMRLAIPSTALLTLVFLQQTYKSAFPTTAYLTFLDKLYAYCYIVAVGLFVLFLWGSNRLAAAPPEQRQQEQRRINRIDNICQWLALLGLGLGAVLAWFL